MDEDLNQILPFYRTDQKNGYSTVLGLSSEGELVIYIRNPEGESITYISGTFDGISAAGGNLYALMLSDDNIQGGMIINMGEAEENLKIKADIEEILLTGISPLTWPVDALPPYTIEEVKDAAVAFLIMSQYIDRALEDEIVTSDESRIIEAGISLINSELKDIEIEGGEGMNAVDLAQARMNFLRDHSREEFITEIQESITQEDWDRMIAEIQEASGVEPQRTPSTPLVSDGEKGLKI